MSELCCSVCCFVSIVLFYVLFVCKCVLLLPGVNPIAVKYIISESNFMKIRLVGAELFHEGERKGRTEEQTNKTKLIVAFRNFANAPKHTTSPPSSAEFHEIWEPKPPGTLWATPGLLRDSFTFTFYLNTLPFSCTCLCLV
jgi:hypothetical protein